jgi:hypothetical protein
MTPGWVFVHLRADPSCIRLLPVLPAAADLLSCASRPFESRRAGHALAVLPPWPPPDPGIPPILALACGSQKRKLKMPGALQGGRTSCMLAFRLRVSRFV